MTTAIQEWTCDRLSANSHLDRSDLDSTRNLISSAKLTPTEHLLLKGFINEAVDPEYAAQYVSQKINQNTNSNIEDVLQDLKRD